MSGVFNSVVVGLDGSAASEQAVPLALRLRADDGQLVALSVAEIHLAAHAGLDSPGWESTLIAAAQEISAKWADELADVPNVVVRTVDGRPADVLLRQIENAKADLIAVGAGRGGRATGFIFGSTATRITRESPCSVLVSRETVDVERFPERIIVGVDGSAPAASAEALAFALGDAYGSDVRRLMATGDEHLNPDQMVRAELDAREPVAALVDASREAGLLVVGSRGLRGLAALGSVAERVAHRAACPVLIVREK